jgi:hypothetical protein
MAPPKDRIIVFSGCYGLHILKRCTDFSLFGIYLGVASEYNREKKLCMEEILHQLVQYMFYLILSHYQVSHLHIVANWCRPLLIYLQYPLANSHRPLK